MPSAYTVGDVVDRRFRVLQIIGQGGMGAVLKVEQKSDAKVYALKYCTQDEHGYRKRFAREVRAMQGINHPHVIRVVESHLEHDPPYFIMPLAKHALDEEIDELKKDESKALKAFEEICRGISAIHASGCVHRDIKPLNALRLPSGRIAVSDLGLAKIDPRDTTTITQSNVLLGTRPYCAPEQLLPGGSRDADQRTDIYQLGKTLYELVTGKSPALIDVTALPPGLGHIIQKATKDVPSQRYGSLGKMMDAIESYRLSKDPTLHPREAFETFVEAAVEDLSEKRYSRKTLERMLSILANGVQLESDTLISLFDSIPDRLLPLMAKELPDEFTICLQRYASATEKTVGSRAFAYAETVADRMNLVFKATKNPELRKWALLATMYAAVDLNRFAAMGVFNEMIVSLSSDDSVPIAEALREQSVRYRRLAGMVSRDKLNGAVRAVRDELVGENTRGQAESGA
jgi:serine/threonine protein kinase